ncbi:MAG TPA: restriction endonuclease subunit S [Pseudogracilibacillus sp.]|nr:restriction endonuclease subunit S [Pseudogracilibacillus sp.]
MSEWKKYKLENLVVFIDGDRGKNYPKQDEYLEKGYCLFLNTSNVTKEGFNFSKVNYISESKDKLLRNGRLEFDDIILTTRGTIGNLALYREYMYYPMRINSSMLILKTKEVLTSEFLYYLLKTQSMQFHMRLFSSGSAQPQLPVRDLKKIEVMIPSRKVQDEIVSILSNYDKLIENNNRRIQILEQTAEELYKEWFVRMRFPGYENIKFDKGIPEGWEVKKVKGLVKRYRYGSLYKENDVMQEGNVIVIDQSEKDFLGFHNNEPDHFAGIDNPIILFGDHSCKMLIMISPFSLSENVIPFNAENNLNTLFLFYAIRGLVHTTEYKRHWSDLTNKRILVPDYSLQQKFEAKVKSIIILINEYKKSNLNFIKQRDLLLPRLMNGTITVK